MLTQVKVVMVVAVAVAVERLWVTKVQEMLITRLVLAVLVVHLVRLVWPRKVMLELAQV
jgi:hypothetical protein